MSYDADIRGEAPSVDGARTNLAFEHVALSHARLRAKPQFNERSTAMLKKFVAPKLTEEATLAHLTLSVTISHTD